jgi:hypothetical protein
MADLWESIKFFVDKGCSRRTLLADLVHEGATLADAEAAVDAAVTSGQLTMGVMHENPDWLVVTEFSPRTADRLRMGGLI